MAYLTPKEIVAELDKYIVGQDRAKRSVAIALRNRYRRSQLQEEMREEIVPKNIIMVGPTGVGKTEIARRISRLMDAPFVKVEATKFTEVGYVGRDVESMVRDLVEAAVRMVKKQRMEMVREQARVNAEERLLDLLVPAKKDAQQSLINPFALLMDSSARQPEEKPEETGRRRQRKEDLRDQLRRGELEDMTLEIEVEVSAGGNVELPGMGGESMNDLLGGLLPPRMKKRRVSVREARKILEQEESEKLIDMDQVIETAVERAEQEGIIFLDEIDKIAGKGSVSGPDVSREGVQRDILPIVEGSTVVTKYGPVKTDFMLFIAAGAFHVAKVSDLIPELQGRFPIRVELDPLTKADFERILTQPKNALTKQYRALLGTEGLEVEFTEDALERIAEIAHLVNENTENIGARRLYSVVENLLEDAFFETDGTQEQNRLVIDAAYVSEHLQKEETANNMQKYIL